MRVINWATLWLAPAMLLLAACQSAGSRSGFYTSPLLPGDEVEILRDVVVPAGLARVYLQHGKTVSYAGTDQYAPFCYFLLRDPLPDEQIISPGLLVVESVWLNQTTVGLEQPVRVASALALGGLETSLIAWQFHITLKSAQQARMILVCSGAFDGPPTAAPIRLPEVREVLGDFAVVRVRATKTAQ